MSLNIHPLFVHFPIAFMTIYALVELIRFKKINSQPYWFYVKIVLLVVGVLGAFVALQTGELAEDEYRAVHQLVETHSFFATFSTVVFGILAGLYIVTWLKECKSFISLFQKNGIRQLWQLLNIIQRVFYRPWFLVLGALMGLGAITITGALGGAIVYGPDVDPIVSWIYHLFFNY